MTVKCIKKLKKLRENEDFDNLSLEQLLWECLRANQYDKEELVMIIDELLKEKDKIMEYENRR